MPKAKDKLIVALDVDTRHKAIELARTLSGRIGALKVGLELFTLAGPDFVRDLVAADHRVFLDLKFHDIPNTVGRASRRAATLGTFMFNVHAGGGAKMMEAAAQAIQDMPEKPLVIGVTVLTSMDEEDLKALNMPGAAKERALGYAILAKKSGLDGVVASAREAAAIKEACGRDFLVVTPGIRPGGSDVGDQKRVMTPGKAIAAGSDYLVVGRPITGADDPEAAASAIVNEIEEALSDL